MNKAILTILILSAIKVSFGQEFKLERNYHFESTSVNVVFLDRNGKFDYDSGDAEAKQKIYYTGKSFRFFEPNKKIFTVASKPEEWSTIQHHNIRWKTVDEDNQVVYIRIKTWIKESKAVLWVMYLDYQDKTCILPLSAVEELEN